MSTRLILSALALLAGSAASAGTIVAYVPAPNAGGISPFIAATGVTGQDLQRGIGLLQPSPVPGNNYNSVGFGGFSLAQGQSNNDVITWGFDSTIAYDLTSLDIAYGRGLFGPQNIEILLSVNSGPAVSIFSDGAIQVGAEQNPGIDLTSFTNVTEADFFLIGWNAANATTGRFSIADAGDDFLFGTGAGVVVYGTAVTPVPLPAGAVLLGGALAVAGLMRRRKQA